MLVRQTHSFDHSRFVSATTVGVSNPARAHRVDSYDAIPPAVLTDLKAARVELATAQDAVRAALEKYDSAARHWRGMPRLIRPLFTGMTSRAYEQLRTAQDVANCGTARMRDVAHRYLAATSTVYSGLRRRRSEAEILQQEVRQLVADASDASMLLRTAANETLPAYLDAARGAARRALVNVAPIEARLRAFLPRCFHHVALADPNLVGLACMRALVTRAGDVTNTLDSETQALSTAIEHEIDGLIARAR